MDPKLFQFIIRIDFALTILVIVLIGIIERRHFLNQIHFHKITEKRMQVFPVIEQIYWLGVGPLFQGQGLFGHGTLITARWLGTALLVRHDV